MAGLNVTGAFADITPRWPLPLGGYTGRSEPFSAVASPLEANAAAFRDGDGRIAVVLALDTLFVGPTVHAALCDHFVRTLGGQERDLLIVASHTHFAPSIDETKPLLGRADPDYSAFVIESGKRLLNRLVAGAGTEAALRRHTGASRAAVNRRLPWPWPHVSAGRRIVVGEACMAPNPDGPSDPTITVWNAMDRAGRTVAILWHFTCHPTGHWDPRVVSAEFPGVVRDRLRREHGPVPVVFLQGFAGDVRPTVPETRPAARRLLGTLILGPGFAYFTETGWRRWADGIAREVSAALASPAVAVEGPRIASALHRVPLPELAAHGGVDRTVLFQRLHLSPLADFVAVGAEPLQGLQRLMPFAGATPVGYLGDVFGYWATDAEARRGGYEVTGFATAFGLKGSLRRPADAKFAAAVRALDLAGGDRR